MAYVSDLPTSCKRLYSQGERPSWKWNGRKLAASDVWLVPTSARLTFMRTVGGTIEDVGGVLSRVVALRFKEFDFATAVSMESVGAFGAPSGSTVSTASWPYDKVRIDYESPDYGEDYISTSFAPLQRQEFKPAAVALGLADDPIDGMTYNVTLHKLARVPLDDWANAAGKINNATWRGFPAYCVKFVGPTGQQEQQFNGVTSYTPTLRFDVSRDRWDYAYDFTGTWTSKGLPTAIDFTSLFGF